MRNSVLVWEAGKTESVASLPQWHLSQTTLYASTALTLYGLANVRRVAFCLRYRTTD